MTTTHINAGNNPLAGTIRAQELAGKIHGDIVILDVRHNRLTGSLYEQYLAGHLPGAVFVELRTDLAGERTGTNGNNPLPDLAVMQERIRTWGIDHDTPVVIYGNAGQPSVGRAWWILRWAGVTDIQILDGGIEAWVASGGTLTQDVPSPQKSSFTSPGESMQHIDMDATWQCAQAQHLLDLRDEELYNRSDSVPDSGHIPGAVNVPYTQFFDEQGFFKTAEQLRATLPEIKAEVIGLTCGGGVAASLAAFVLEHLGVKTAVHIGSWSEWRADPSRPVA